MSDVQVGLRETVADGDGSARVRAVLETMTLEEKLGQVVGFWVDRGGDMVAPMADQMTTSAEYDEATAHGLGHLTRVYGTHPVDPAERALWLRRAQRRLTEVGPGLPAIVHEECLTGLAAWQATTYPAPPAWGASFDPELVEQMGAQIGASMRALGIHQGLAPVLDVVRDARWGRVEECVGEDPYLVGTVTTAYVRGMQSTGVIATLKHFVGYSASQAGRNLAPVHAGPREVADVLLPPFEMAVLDGGVDSVMPAYVDVDGVPAHADTRLLTTLLRDRWGFEGTVVSDYFGVAFLHALHGVAGDLGDAAGQSLAAGVDIELPSGDAYAAPLAAAVRDGRVPMALLDRAVLRVLVQKEALGLLDERFDEPEGPVEPIDLDPPEHRALARRIAEESVVLLANDGVLPLLRRDGDEERPAPATVAVIGPNADRSAALFGCYSFVNHVLDHHPETPMGLAAPTVLDGLRAELEGVTVTHAQGCTVREQDRSGIGAAVELAAAADVAVLVVGDHAGLFGRGTSGEGCDAEGLELPGVQRELVEAVLDTGTPVVLVMVTGRPYAVGWALERCAAVVQAFFPGEEGGHAVAAVISGAVVPSGRMPLSVPRSVAAMPSTYLHARLAGPSSVSNLDPEPPLAFGHGLSYTTFTHTDLVVDQAVPAGGAVQATVRVTNTGTRRGADVVQLYGHDVVASLVRPVAQLLAYARVELDPGESATVTFDVPSTLLAFADLDLVRVVEPGAVELWVGPDCRTRECEATVELTGDVHRVTTADRRRSEVTVTR